MKKEQNLSKLINKIKKEQNLSKYSPFRSSISEVKDAETAISEIFFRFLQVFFKNYKMRNLLIFDNLYIHKKC